MKASFIPAQNGLVLARALTLAAATALSAASSWSAETHHYKVIDLGELSGAGLNNAGQVVGVRDVAGEGRRGFVWDATRGFQEISTGAGRDTVASAISGKGLVVGYSYGTVAGSDSRETPFVWSQSGGMRQIDLPASALYGKAVGVNNNGTVLLQLGFSDVKGIANSTYTWTEQGGLKPVLQGTPGSQGYTPIAINDGGSIAGYNSDSVPPGAFVHQADGTKVELGTPGGRWSGPAGINSQGWVVGTGAIAEQREVCTPVGCEMEDIAHAFIWNKERGLIDLDAGNAAATSYGEGINNLGQVVGLTVGKGAFLWENGEKTFINGLLLDDRFELQTARAINDQGLILAFSTDGHTLLLSPAPEPETVALFLAGIAVLGWQARRRRPAEAG
ncbi:PEP-CTERM sorting domain-containing protein [Aquabacterium sp. A7-Y]|uniref:PEP-CTERM sorting domain-containing protein n=1 Tax=Aquabacterium sp. A7-Y TaxID=1349605 RepID=UPI00223CD9C2|nr:PEP-CTERM sorting domain-containing protein [Aquabacterium sp. A7-Y]MCW7540519.1 PEP-CTERM sorting domain-containing protein [Aquabacterium sp. A7-Y]